MTRKFVIMPEFDKQWKAMKLTDDDLKNLQETLLQNPQAGDLVQGTGGLRKMRFAFPNQGKSGSARVVYVDFTTYECIYLITAYPKNVKDNLSNTEKAQIKKVIDSLEKGLQNKRG